MISEMLGHSSVAFTMDVYGHVLPRLQRQAATEMDAIFDSARKAQREREEKDKSLSGAVSTEKDAEKSGVN